MEKSRAWCSDLFSRGEVTSVDLRKHISLPLKIITQWRKWYKMLWAVYIWEIFALGPITEWEPLLLIYLYIYNPPFPTTTSTRLWALRRNSPVLLRVYHCMSVSWYVLNKQLLNWFESTICVRFRNTAPPTLSK